MGWNLSKQFMLFIEIDFSGDAWLKEAHITLCEFLPFVCWTKKINIFNLHMETYSLTGKMQGAIQAIVSHGSIVKNAVLHQIRLVNPIMPSVVFSRLQSVTSARMEEHGFESTTIADVLKGKGKSADGSWLWCTTDDSVYDAVKSVCIFVLCDTSNFCYAMTLWHEDWICRWNVSLPFQMTHHNVGALVVVKPGEQKSIAGIITERGKWRIPLFTFLVYAWHIWYIWTTIVSWSSLCGKIFCGFVW